MVRVMWLLRRKPGISFEDFRTHYENSHAVLGETYLGYLLLAYRRNYVLPVESVESGNPLVHRVLAAKAWDYDCITEWDFADMAAFEQAMATIADHAIGKLFHDDEEHFLDRSSVRIVISDQRETDTSQSVVPAPVTATADGHGGNPWNI